MPPILSSQTEWYCPNCTHRDVTVGVADVEPGGGVARLHACAGLRGLLAPLVPVGTRCKVEAVDREDYVGTDLVRRDGDGRPVMAVHTTRDDGEDRLVFAPTVVFTGGSA